MTFFLSGVGCIRTETGTVVSPGECQAWNNGANNTKTENRLQLLHELMIFQCCSVREQREQEEGLCKRGANC